MSKKIPFKFAICIGTSQCLAIVTCVIGSFCALGSTLSSVHWLLLLLTAKYRNYSHSIVPLHCVEWTAFDIAKRQTDFGSHNRFHFITKFIASNLWSLLGIVRWEFTTVAMALIKRIFETIHLIFGLQFDKSKHFCLKSILNRVQQRQICIMHWADIQLNIFSHFEYSRDEFRKL